MTVEDSPRREDTGGAQDSCSWQGCNGDVKYTLKDQPPTGFTIHWCEKHWRADRLWEDITTSGATMTAK